MKGVSLKDEKTTSSKSLVAGQRGGVEERERELLFYAMDGEIFECNENESQQK